MSKKIMAFVCGIIVLVIACITSCTTTGTVGSASDIVNVSRTGYIAVGRIEQINSDLERIQSRFGSELEVITGTVHDLGTTIHRLVEFANGLLNEIDQLRDTISTLTENPEYIVDYLDRVDIIEDNNVDIRRHP